MVYPAGAGHPQPDCEGSGRGCAEPGAKRWGSQSGFGEARKELEMELRRVGLNIPALLDAPEPRVRTK